MCFLIGYGWGLVLLLSSAHTGSSWRMFGVALFLLVALPIALYDGYLEIKQACANPKGLLFEKGAYFRNMQNVTDAALVLSTVLLAALLFLWADEELVWLVRGMAATSVMFVLPKAKAVARGNERLSFLCNVLVTTICDMRSFLGIMLFIMANFAFAFAILAGFEGEYAGFLDIAFSVYALQLGDFEQDSFRPSAGIGMATLFFGYTFLVNIVALNALIALMGDSWEKTQETADARGLQQKAELLLELEHSLSDAQRRDENLFPAWLHCLQPKQDGDDAADDGWQGRVAATVKGMSTRIDNARYEILSAVQLRIDAVEASMDAKLDKTFDELKELVTSLKADLFFTLVADDQRVAD